MHFKQNYLYHIYNRSNRQVFMNRDNYLFFLKKIKSHIQPVCEILAWCLMPNHFHFMIYTTEQSALLINEKHRERTQQLSKSIGTLLSSYTQAFNKQYHLKGSLWAHNTEAIILNDIKDAYACTCFHYIHQNPVKARLAAKMEDWEFSSYIDYTGARNGKLINKELAYSLLNIDKEHFKEQSEIVLNEQQLKHIFA